MKQLNLKTPILQNDIVSAISMGFIHTDTLHRVIIMLLLFWTVIPTSVVGSPD